MAITNVFPLLVGEAGVIPNQWKIVSNDNLDTVLQTGYLTNVANNFGYSFSNGDIVYIGMIMSNTPCTGFFQISISNNQVSLINPENIVEISGTPLSNQIAYFVNANTLASTGTGIIYHRGDIQAGTDAGIEGKFTSFPDGAATGSLSLSATQNNDNHDVTITNTVFTQDTTLRIPDPGVANGSFMMSAITICDIGANLVSFDVTVGHAALAVGASVTLNASSSTKQYKIRSLWVNSNGTNFSGGGGDRLLSITDNTTVYSVIPAASLQTLANTAWGVTGLPFPASAAINTSTAAGASLVAKYSGGTTDYTAGSVVISGILERVA